MKLGADVQLNEGPETAHGQRGCSSERKLGLVVGVLVVLRERLVQEGGALLGGVRLDAERVADGENLEQIGQIAVAAAPLTQKLAQFNPATPHLLHLRRA